MNAIVHMYTQANRKTHFIIITIVGTMRMHMFKYVKWILYSYIHNRDNKLLKDYS